MRHIDISLYKKMKRSPMFNILNGGMKQGPELPCFLAVVFIDTTSEPDPASLIASAPMCSPEQSYKKTKMMMMTKSKSYRYLLNFLD